MRIAYKISVYKNPDQVSRLIERIYSPTDHFYVHRDKRTPSDERWEALSRKYRDGNVFFASERKTDRCGFRVVETTLDAMNYWRNSDFDYLVNLSGQCYPIRPLNVIKEELGRKSVAYMEYFKLPTGRSAGWGEDGGLNRIHYYSVILNDEGLRIRIPRLNRDLPYHLEPYGGSGFYCLPRRFVEYIRDYVSNHPRMVSFYRHCYMPGEMFFQTIIMNSGLRCDVVNDDRRYIRWVEDAGHPTILRKEDFNEIMRSDKLFARKFDISTDRDILDLIDGEIQLD